MNANAKAASVTPLSFGPLGPLEGEGVQRTRVHVNADAVWGLSLLLQIDSLLARRAARRAAVKGSAVRCGAWTHALTQGAEFNN